MREAPATAHHYDGIDSGALQELSCCYCGRLNALEVEMRLKDVVPSPDMLMGVKAVWGAAEEPLMCFGSRSENPAAKDRAHFSQARRTAERAQSYPFFITIGGGKQVPLSLEGRTLELVKCTGVYGETGAFAQSDQLRSQLAQWPVAVMLSEVFEICGYPHLVDDLGFPDRRILRNAYDTVLRQEDRLEALWQALKDQEIRARKELQFPPGFYDPGKVVLFSSSYPKLTSASNEGKRRWKLACAAERDQRLKTQVKALNRDRHGGTIVCEACGFRHVSAKLFDVHHLLPIAAGERNTRVDDLAVLCPTCHRWAHAMADDKLSPLPIDAVARQRSGE
jgi:5-methylcytosine-specific restriction enzyme A